MTLNATLVGSRAISDTHRKQIVMAGFLVASKGYHGRSGHADGADSEFYKGYRVYARASVTKVSFTNYVPWKGFAKDDNYVDYEKMDQVQKKEAQRIAMEVMGKSHWGNLSPAAKKLHTRNVFQVIGDDFESPSDVLVCCAEPTPFGVKGGTNTAFLLASAMDIPCLNLYTNDGRKEFYEYMREV